MRSLRSTLVVGSAICVLVGGQVSAMAGGNPPGNNGTVKVAGPALGTSRGNESHVGCALAIEFFGFDEGDLTGTATFELQAPTGNGVLLVDSTSIGEDPAGGGTDLDATLYGTCGTHRHIRGHRGPEPGLPRATHHRCAGLDRRDDETQDVLGDGLRRRRRRRRRREGGRGRRSIGKHGIERGRSRTRATPLRAEYADGSAGRGRGLGDGFDGVGHARRVVDRPRRGSGPATPEVPRSPTPSRTRSR